MHESVRLQNQNQKSGASLHTTVQSRRLTAPAQSNFPSPLRGFGNQAMQYSLRQAMIQTKLKVSTPGDKYEREADRVADAVMRMPDAQGVNAGQGEFNARDLGIQRMCAGCEEEMHRQPMEEEEGLQAKGFSGQSPRATPNVITQINAMRGGGNPLSNSTRQFFEPRFGQDFSNVRVHTGSAAAETARGLNARAYTRGKDVMFGAGQYSPETPAGKRLLAHELTHVVQQNVSGLDNSSEGVVQRTVSFDVQDWDGIPQGPPTLQNGPDPRAFLIPHSGQILVNPSIQVNGDATDNCAGFQVGTTQTAWIAWTIGHYRGQHPGEGSIRVQYRASMPMRDPGLAGDIWYDPAQVKSPINCGDIVDIFHADSPWQVIAKMRNNGAVAGNPLNYLRSYTRGLHLVTYLTARDPSGNFLTRPLRFIYWNSLQDFSFTPDFASPLNMWTHTGQVRVNIGAKGRGDTTDAPYFTTTGPHFGDHFNDPANFDVDERA